MDEVTKLQGIDRFIATMVLAFSTDPFVRWLFPEPAKFLSYFAEITRIHGERTAAYGGAYGLTDGRGAAFWYPPGTHSDGDALGAVLKKAGVMERLSQLLEGVSEYEPNEPHWYLRQIGIDPVLQRKGQGARLLEAGLADVDQRGDLAYLEATSATSRKFYERFGFSVLGEVQALDSVLLWPMYRGRK
jgi:ribosomal protein S18 acetylase RimI-like enzyme